MRHPHDLIEKIKNLRQQNATMGEIISATGLSKTTIHWYIKNIPKTRALVEKLQKSHQIRINNLANKRRGRTFKTYAFKKPHEWNPDFIMLVAHFMFDGEIKKTSSMYNNRSLVLIDRVIK